MAPRGPHGKVLPSPLHSVMHRSSGHVPFPQRVVGTRGNGILGRLKLGHSQPSMASKIASKTRYSRDEANWQRGPLVEHGFTAWSPCIKKGTFDPAGTCGLGTIQCSHSPGPGSPRQRPAGVCLKEQCNLRGARPWQQREGRGIGVHLPSWKLPHRCPDSSSPNQGCY